MVTIELQVAHDGAIPSRHELVPLRGSRVPRRATARHNLALFTPTGIHRAGALAVLRDVSIALGDGDTSTAERILRAVEPEPADDSPAVSHVIGAGLGILDTWRLRPELRQARVPSWHRKASQQVAAKGLRFAASGSAFDALDELIRQFGGLRT